MAKMAESSGDTRARAAGSMNMNTAMMCHMTGKS